MSFRNSWINKYLEYPMNLYKMFYLIDEVMDLLTYFLLPLLISLQDFKLTSDGSIVVLDWFTAGRMALGEVWDMTR